MSDLKEQISIAGENSLIIYFSQQPDENTIQKISLINTQLNENLSNFIIDSIPSYISILVTWDNLIIDYMNFKRKIVQCLKNISFEKIKGKNPPKIIVAALPPANISKHDDTSSIGKNVIRAQLLSHLNFLVRVFDWI